MHYFLKGDTKFRYVDASNLINHDPKEIVVIEDVDGFVRDLNAKTAIERNEADLGKQYWYKSGVDICLDSQYDLVYNEKMTLEDCITKAIQTEKPVRIHYKLLQTDLRLKDIPYKTIVPVDTSAGIGFLYHSYGYGVRVFHSSKKIRVYKKRPSKPSSTLGSSLYLAIHALELDIMGNQYLKAVIRQLERYAEYERKITQVRACCYILEHTSPDFINNHLVTLVALAEDIKKYKRANSWDSATEFLTYVQELEKKAKKNAKGRKANQLQQV